MRIVIAREYDNLQTMGHLIVFDGSKKRYECKTLELPSLGNQRNVSCIPEGVYNCNKWLATSKGDVIRVLSVPGRDGILIHKGNFASGGKVDSKGCILVGTAFEDINGDGNMDVIQTGIAMGRLIESLPENFKLYII
jgi:hypothetical protein